MTSTKTQQNSTAPSFTMRPRIKSNPNPRVPLAAVLSFVADRKVQTHVTINDGRRQWELHFSKETNPAGGLPLLGFRPGHQHSFKVSIGDDGSGFTTFENALS